MTKTTKDMILRHLQARSDGTLARSGWPSSVLIFGWGSKKMIEDSPLDLAFELTEPTAIHNLELLMASNVECLGV